MLDNSRQVFENQLPDVFCKFPNLKAVIKNSCKYISGIVDVNVGNEIVCSYLIEIHCSANFPYRFPKLYETGGEIPCLADWHKYSDESCCITVEPDEIIQCAEGITICSFIKNNVVPYFANQYYRKTEGYFLNEYSHGLLGLKEFYTTLLGGDNIDVWLQYYDYAFDRVKVPKGRNDPCLCGSTKKMKKCHSLIFEKMKLIGKEKILLDFRKIIHNQNQ